MAGTKRASDAAETGTATRAAKAAKTDSSDAPTKVKATPKPKKEKVAKAPVVSAEEFKSQALPLHFNLTHTPPSIADAETVPSASADPGHIGSVTMTPTTFSTGSFGWKGSNKFTIELQNGGEGEKATVTVNLSINATVSGSKPSKAKKAAAGKKKAAKDDEDEEEEEEADDED